MNKSQINKSRMFGTVDLVLDNHSSLFTLLVELITAHQRLKDGQALIRQYRQVQEADSSGLTQNKILLKADVIDGILKFSAALRAYATSVKNEELKVKSHYVASDLKKTPDPILFDIGVLLVGLADPVKTDLVKYSIVEADFAAINSLLATFKIAYAQPRVATAEAKVSTGNIGEVFKSLDKLLKDEIDELMLPFQFSQPDFYNAYKNARIIVNYSGRCKTKTETPAVSA